MLLGPEHPSGGERWCPCAHPILQMGDRPRESKLPAPHSLAQGPSGKLFRSAGPDLEPGVRLGSAVLFLQPQLHPCGAVMGHHPSA